MSNQRRYRRVSLPTIDRRTAMSAARMSCVLRGCTCEPNYLVTHDALGTRVRIEHDDWCPAHPEQNRTMP